MKVKLKTLRGDIFATVYLHIYPFIHLGAIFTYEDCSYKILDVSYIATTEVPNNKELSDNLIPTVIVTPVQTI